MRLNKYKRRRGAAVTLAVLLTWLVPATVSSPPAGATSAQLSGLRFTQKWTSKQLPDAGAPIAESSPMLASLDTQGPSVVVGDRAGHVYAYHLADGTPVTGWPVYTHGPAIDSTPSVAPLGGSGLDTVFVGTGYAGHTAIGGGYEAFNPDGTTLWETSAPNPPTDRKHPASGVQASLTVASVQSKTAVFAGSMGQESYALDASDGLSLPGFPFFSSDTVFSTAAAGDLYGTGQTELVVGGGQTAGLAYGQQYQNGGHLRILNSHGGLICHYDTNQEVDSSPAVGAFLPNGAIGVVMGTGSFFAGVSDTDVVDAFDTRCNRQWSTALDGVTSSSPALADLFGTGQLDVVEGTQSSSRTGSVWAINGATGTVIWHTAATGPVIGSVVTADLSGHGYQDILVPTTHGVDVLDGRTGGRLKVLNALAGYQNSPLVTDDPNGTIGVTIAGYDGANAGVVNHYEIPGSNGALAVASGSWPMFHHDPQLSGVSGALPARGSIATCQVPSAAIIGYDMVASDGGVFSFGQPYCGSEIGVIGNPPVVGIAMAPDTGGYWVALANGAVQGYGQAIVYSSLNAEPISSPIVAIATTPDGHGYWLAAANGDVYAFGDAHYYGSMAGTHLDSPVVSIAATPDGLGYRLAAADGGVFCFGDGRYHGSLAGVRLNSKIVGIEPDLAKGGYWLVSAEGGVFSFGTPFSGSTGHMKLNGSVVGMAATADARGYWLVARDGGVFGFGDAPFQGSMGSRSLNAPVAAIAGYSG